MQSAENMWRISYLKQKVDEHSMSWNWMNTQKDLKIPVHNKNQKNACNFLTKVSKTQEIAAAYTGYSMLTCSGHATCGKT